MNKRRAIRNMIMAVLLVAVAITGGIVAVASIHLVLSLPR
jgi:phosphopantothenoylcysteine synthetase/decarboxylase